MGEKVKFGSNGHTCEGYLTAPVGGSGPAVVVIQEWWGLVPHIEDLVDRFAAEGYLAMAPDLYHGAVAKSPDVAKKLLMELDVERAEQEIAGSAGYLLSRPECSSSNFGVIGFCMGGALAQYEATKNPKTGAAVSFYGGFARVTPDWENLQCPILLIYGDQDSGVPASKGVELGKQLHGMGKDAKVAIYSANHAFFNDTRPEVFNREAADDAWNKTITLFRQSLR